MRIHIKNFDLGSIAVSEWKSDLKYMVIALEKLLRKTKMESGPKGALLPD